MKVMLARCVALCVLGLSVGCADVGPDGESAPDTDTTMTTESAAMGDPAGHPDGKAAEEAEACEDEDCDDDAALPPAYGVEERLALQQYLVGHLRVDPALLDLAFRGEGVAPGLPSAGPGPGPIALPTSQLSR